jgi:hypothetical protein
VTARLAQLSAAFLVVALLVSFHKHSSACTRFDLNPIRVGNEFDVVLHDRGKPVIGMGVVVERWRLQSKDWEQVAKLTTGLTGAVHFAGLAVGFYQVATDTPAENDSQPIEVTKNSNKADSSNIELHWPPRRALVTKAVEGSLSSFPDGDDPSVPIVGVQLTILEAYSGRDVAETYTDGDGHFRVDGLPPGLFFIRLLGEDSQDQRRRFFGDRLRGTIAMEYNPLAPNALTAMPLHVAITSCSDLMYRLAK